jgi:hypothetical protein
MWANQLIQVSGCITQEKYIKGKSLSEIERILGFHYGRLNSGIVVAALLKIPGNDQFNLLGYTQVSEHRFNNNALSGLDVTKIKNFIRANVFTLTGIDRLIKVIPNTGHQSGVSDDEQYPPGHGVPQWKLTDKLPARVIAVVLNGQKYS